MCCDFLIYLPLLEAVRSPVAVNPDTGPAALAAERGWGVVWLHA